MEKTVELYDHNYNCYYGNIRENEYLEFYSNTGNCYRGKITNLSKFDVYDNRGNYFQGKIKDDYSKVVLIDTSGKQWYGRID